MSSNEMNKILLLITEDLILKSCNMNKPINMDMAYEPTPTLEVKYSLILIWEPG